MVKIIQQVLPYIDREPHRSGARPHARHTVLVVYLHPACAKSRYTVNLRQLLYRLTFMQGGLTGCTETSYPLRSQQQPYGEHLKRRRDTRQTAAK